MWEDMKLYWAWRGVDTGQYLPKTPTDKRLEYVVIHYPDWVPEPMTMKICCGVFDNDKYTELHRDEIKWHQEHGARITWPEHTKIGVL